MDYEFNPDSVAPLDWARAYRRLGMQAVPAHHPRTGPNYKRPALTTWKQHQTLLAPDGVFGSWSFHDNLGMITGVNGLWILDVDLHKHPEARQWFDTLLVVHNNGLPLNSPTQQTGGGGLQILLRAPMGWSAPTFKTPIGVDVRGVGGFAMLPPSMHASGRRYEWHDGLEPWAVPVLESPEWLCWAVDELQTQHRAEGAVGESGARRTSPPPEGELNAFGRQTDGRESFAVRLIWARIVDLRRECPIAPGAAETEMLEAFDNYEMAVKSRLTDPTKNNAALLEQEGRGITMFRAKWRAALRKWDTTVKDAAAIPPPGMVEPQDQPQAPQLPTAEVASAAMVEPVRAFMARAEAVLVVRQRFAASEHGAEGVLPPRLLQAVPLGESGLVKADIGLGKTHVVIDEVIRLIDGHHEGTGEFDGPLVDRRVEYIVSNHRLAEEVAGRFNACRPDTASVWKGMGQLDAVGQQMCRRYADMIAWTRAGGDADQMCSRCQHSPKSDDPCGYRTQATSSPVLVCALPDAITSAPVPGIWRKLKTQSMERAIDYGADLTIIDESQPTQWLGGFGPKPYLIGTDVFAGKVRPPFTPKGWGRDQWSLWDRYTDLLQDLINVALANVGHGERGSVTNGELREVFREAESWRDFRRDVLSLKASLKTHHASLRGPVLKDAIRSLAGWNARVMSIAELAFVAAQALDEKMPDGTALPDQAECPLITAVNGTAAGTGLVLKWRRPVAYSRLGKPVLVLDASADVAVLRRWLPSLEVVTDARARLPNGCVTILQVSDCLCAYGSYVPKSPAAVANESQKAVRSTALNNCRRLVWLIDYLSSLAGDAGVGVIVPKGTEATLEAIWAARDVGRPANVLIGHYGAIRGVDVMREVRVLLLWSRPTPPPCDVEELAKATFSQPVAALDGWYQAGPAHYVIRNGTRVTATKAERHPDQYAERFRVMACDDELTQAVGRARALRRDASRSLLVIIGTAQPNQIPVDRLVTVKDALFAGPIEALAARGVVVPTGSANKGYAQVLSAATGLGVQAVKDAVRRLNVANPYRDIPLGEFHVDAAIPEGTYKPFRLKLTASSRFWTEVRLRPDLDSDPAAALAREGIHATLIEAMTPQPQAALAPKTEVPEAGFVLRLFAAQAALYSGCPEAANDLAALGAEWPTLSAQSGWPPKITLLFGQRGMVLKAAA